MQYIGLITMGISLLMSLIQMAEQLFPATGAGALKKDAVLTAFTNAWTAASTAGFGTKIFQIPADQMKAGISGLIDLIVEIFNATGTFKPAAPVTPAPTI